MMTVTELFEEIEKLYAIADRITDKDLRHQLCEIIEAHLKKTLFSEDY